MGEETKTSMEWYSIAHASWVGLVNGVNYALFALGLTLVFGIMFVVNMAHGELFMMGAILTYFIMTFLGMDFFLAAFIGILSVAAFGFVFNRIAIQPLIDKPFWVPLISTIGVSMMMKHGALAILKENSSFPMDTIFTGLAHLGEVTVRTEGIVLCGIGVAVIVAVYLFLQRSRMGKDMKATIQSPIGAGLCGVDTRRVYTYTIVLASGLAALAGILNGALHSAYPTMGEGMLLKGFAIVIVAGMGNLVGASILAIVIGLAESLFSLFFIPYLRQSFVFGIMVLVLLLRPEGVFVSTRDS